MILEECGVGQVVKVPNESLDELVSYFAKKVRDRLGVIVQVADAATAEEAKQLNVLHRPGVVHVHFLKRHGRGHEFVEVLRPGSLELVEDPQSPHDRRLERAVRQLVVRFGKPGWDDKNGLAELAQGVMSASEGIASPFANACRGLANHVLLKEPLDSPFNTAKLVSNVREQLILMASHSMALHGSLSSPGCAA